LDIGCGNGYLSYKIACRVKWLIGVDIVRKFEYDRDNMHLFVSNDTKNYIRGTATTIVLSNVLEHIKDRVKFLKDIKPLAKKFLIRVPMLDRDWLTLYKKELGVEYRLDKGHFIEYTEQSFRDEVKEAGYKIVKLEIRFGEIYAILK
jgi:SAM-dependent methyltransferase